MRQLALAMTALLLLAGCAEPGNEPNQVTDSTAIQPPVATNETWYADPPERLSKIPREGSSCAWFAHEGAAAGESWSSGVHRARSASQGFGEGEAILEFYWVELAASNVIEDRQFWVKVWANDTLVAQQQFRAPPSWTFAQFFLLDTDYDPILVPLTMEPFPNGSILSLQYGHTEAHSDYSVCAGERAPRIHLLAGTDAAAA